MKKSVYLLSLICLILAGCHCASVNNAIIDRATQQLSRQCLILDENNLQNMPRTTKNGQTVYVPQYDWCSGFFPGTVLTMYQLTNDSIWLQRGLQYTQALDTVERIQWTHDIGFMVMCSYGKAYQLTAREDYKQKIISAAHALTTRFYPKLGVFQSWNVDEGWQSQRGWECPTIIDNMMNLELLFETTRITGDSTFWKMAVSHADTTMKYHFRPDYSTYHVVDYDKQNGGFRSRCTAQGFANESCWARGQAWALYGYTMCYRYTRDERYLEQAKHIYDYIFTHPNLPQDLVPYWDFNAPDIPNTYRDAAAAAIIASALVELSQWVPQYKATAEKLINNLASDTYLANNGENGYFLLKHCVGSLPHGNEIDVPLNYADYYLLEAVLRSIN